MIGAARPRLARVPRTYGCCGTAYLSTQAVASHAAVAAVADGATSEPLVLVGVEQRGEARLDAVGHHLSAAEHPIERGRVRAQPLLLQEACGEAGAAEREHVLGGTVGRWAGVRQSQGLEQRAVALAALRDRRELPGAPRETRADGHPTPRRQHGACTNTALRCLEARSVGTDASAASPRPPSAARRSQ